MSNTAIVSQIAAVPSTGKVDGAREIGASIPVCNGGEPEGDELRYLLGQHPTDVWPIERSVRFVLAYRKGASFKALAGLCGVSKNAAVGRAHRLVEWGILKWRPGGSAGRPALSRGGESGRGANDGMAALVRAKAAQPAPPPVAPVPAPCVPCATIPPLASAAPAEAIEVAAPPPAASPPLPPRYGRVTDCAWPSGTPGTPAFRFCDAPTEPGRPYCAAHCRSAFMPSRPRSIETLISTPGRLSYVGDRA